MTISDEALRSIVQTGEAETLVAEAKKIADSIYHQYENKLPITQFRAIFGHFRQIQRVWREDDNPAPYYRKLQLMRPKLAYQTARIQQLGILSDVLTRAIPLVHADQDSYQRFQNLMDFFEAILAYLIADKGTDK